MRLHDSQDKHEESSTQQGLHTPIRTLPVSLVAVAIAALLAMILASCGDSSPTPTETSILSDRDTLTALYNATNGPGWTANTNWLSAMPMSTWIGVTTDENGRVTELDLNGNRLDREIPQELGSLSNLQVLDLSGNKLRGRIPRQLGNLSKLEVLDLRRNRLSGGVPPELSNLANLAKLGIGGNGLTGSFPQELSNLQKLTYLDVGGTLLNGCLPDSWRGRFEVRSANDDSFDEESDLGGLPLCIETSEPVPPASRDALVALHNQTRGSLWKYDLNWKTVHPVSVWHGVKVDPSGRVIELRLPNNGLIGDLPPELGNLIDLRVLDLHRNDLTGEIPPELGRLSTLESMDLSVNRLDGELPPELRNLTNLTEIHLHVNELSGGIPPQLGALSNLSTLSLWNNRFSGEIPQELGEIHNLRVLELHGNSLSGDVPPQLGALSNLQRLGLDGNDFDGCVPSSLRGRLRMSESTLGMLPFCGFNSVPQGPAATGAGQRRARRVVSSSRRATLEKQDALAECPPDTRMVRRQSQRERARYPSGIS